MTTDIAAAETFVLTHARLLERRRLAVLLHDEDPRAVLTTLAAYQNDDGGFGQALEPDVRGPHSETTATLTALELLDALGALDQSAAGRALRWVGTVARGDGGIPFVLPASSAFPQAPWMQPADEGSHLTFAFAAIARRADTDETWVRTAQDWCWDKVSRPDQINGYLLKYALNFLDAHADDPRAAATLSALKHLVGPDGCVAVPGGTEDEKLTPLALSPHANPAEPVDVHRPAHTSRPRTPRRRPTERRRLDFRLARMVSRTRSRLARRSNRPSNIDPEGARPHLTAGCTRTSQNLRQSRSAVSPCTWCWSGRASPD